MYTTVNLSPVLLYKSGVKGGQNYTGMFSWCGTLGKWSALFLQVRQYLWLPECFFFFFVCVCVCVCVYVCVCVCLFCFVLFCLFIYLFIIVYLFIYLFIHLFFKAASEKAFDLKEGIFFQ